MVVDAGDPRPIAKRFAAAPEVAVVDLDAARGHGDNGSVVRDLLRMARCRVGGGIRSVDRALDWLDTGATKVVLGSLATLDAVRQLPRERVVAALDTRDGEVVTHGWTKRTGADVVERMRELREHVGGFLVTFVEREGRMGGLPWETIAALKRETGDAQLVIAGGARSAQDIARADDLGVDVQVGMALYTGALDLGDGLVAPMRPRKKDALYPTVVCDEQGVALGLAWSNRESVREAVRTGKGVYWSRSRSALWRKGEMSGDTQRLLRVDLDCDRDALRFVVEQAGAGFCHTGSRACFGEDWGLGRLSRRLSARMRSAPEGSYTAALAQNPDLLRDKLLEEAEELASAQMPHDIAWEAADVLYFTCVALAARGVPLAAVEAMLDRRALRVRRRSQIVDQREGAQ